MWWLRENGGKFGLEHTEFEEPAEICKRKSESTQGERICCSEKGDKQMSPGVPTTWVIGRQTRERMSLSREREMHSLKSRNF